MHREPVESEALRSIGYDVEQHTLEIEFTSGSVYRYLDVPAHLHVGLMIAGSHGTFFAEQIRSAGYDYEQLA